jgi:putative PEP-CTERM system TPR-repeat lipoprotein
MLHAIARRTSKSPSRLRHGLAIAFVALGLAACAKDDPASYVASAQTYLANGDYNAAIIQLKNALRVAPNQANVRFMMAKALLETGNPVDAETEARKALGLKHPEGEALPLLVRALLVQGQYKKVAATPVDPKLEPATARADVETSRAIAYLALGERQAAHKALDAALSAQPAYAPAKLTQVRLAVADNDMQKALALVDALVAAAPKEIEALILKSDVQAAMGQRDAAIHTLEGAAGVRPDSAPVRWALIVAYVNSGQIKEAREQLTEVRKLAPENPRTWYTEALLAYSQGELAAARTAVDRAKHLAPDYVPALFLSGLIDIKLQAWPAAEAALRTVVAKIPDDESARQALALVFVRRGKAVQALDALDPLLRRAPSDPALLRTVAEVHLAGNNPAKAAEFFARAAKVDAGNVAGRVRLAQVRMSTGDARALKDLEGLALAEPSASEPDLALISAHLQRRDFDKALASALALEKKQPNRAATYNVKGVVLMARGDRAGARVAFEKGVAVDPDYVAAAFNLARLDLIEGNVADARKRYEAMLVKDPQSEPVLLALAELLSASKAPPAEVRAAIERAITANPTLVRPRMVLISYNGQLRDWKAAVAAAQKAQSALPDNAQIAEALGMVQFAGGETNQAVATFRRATQMQPDSPALQIRLGEALARTKDYDGALEALRAALELNPDATGVWLALVGVYVDADRVNSGIEFARSQQKRRADRAVGYALEGELLARQNKPAEAAGAYRTALARQPSTFVVSRVHSVLQLAGKTDEANAVTAQWLREHPADATVRMYLAEQSLNRKDWRAAATLLRAALDAEPDNVMLLNNLGWTLGELGDPKAVEYAARAYALAPNSPVTNDTYGWVLVQRGDTAKGLPLLRRAVELAPDDAEKRLRLARALLKAGDNASAKRELETLVSAQNAAAVRPEAEKLLKTL